MALGKVNAVDLAKYIMAKCGGMNHLKLQKLLYYVQAWHLAYFQNTPVIPNKFEAWLHGPVCREVWNEFKRMDSPLYREITVPKSETDSVIDRIEKSLVPEQVELIRDVLAEYGDKSAYHLECLTHEERPWIEARNGVPDGEASDAPISESVMAEYYRSLLYPP